LTALGLGGPIAQPRRDARQHWVVRAGATDWSHEARRKSSARGVTAETYSGVGSFGETKAINRPPTREADWVTTW